MSFISPKFVILAILDGWGIAPPSPGNAITLSNIVNMPKFMASYPHTQLGASGEAVGLPHNEDGNTETGHINIGAGRIVYQDLERINMSIADGTFYNNTHIKKCFDFVKKNNSNLHIMGLAGSGGVHSNINHLYALLHFSSSEGIKNLYIHLFTDGRDSPQTFSKTLVIDIQKHIENEKIGNIASIMGRYWAMDRDQRWDRTEKAYNALVLGEGKYFENPLKLIESSYAEGKTDEFIEPSLIVKGGKPIGLINDGDGIIFYNFRIDRPRQLTKAFIYKDLEKAKNDKDVNPYSKVGLHTGQFHVFNRKKLLKNILFTTMTDYGKSITGAGATPAFPPEVVETPLSRIISNEQIQQYKITESEKERFVTFYFNGYREIPFPLEDRDIIPSAKVTTYDQKPQMEADKITQTLISKMQNQDYKFAVVNFPNADMVGHTGNIGPCLKAVEKVDECIGKLANSVLANEGMLILTADHGNAEEMINQGTGEIDTEHSTNPVPFISIYRQFLGKNIVLKSGILSDIAPTILSILNISIPTSMTGRNLLAEVIV